MAGSGTDTIDPQEIIYCVNHPRTETLIRCSRCLDPICTKCAIRTPVGLRCPTCARRGRSPLYVLAPQDYPIIAIVALAVSLVAGALATQAGLFFTVFLSIPAGGIIAEAVLRARRKRGRPVQIITGVCIALGALAGPVVLRMVASGGLALPANALVLVASLLNLNSILFAVLAIGAAVARLR
ncbi:MAG TPA: hypothetical protein GX714_05890 [Chloroflexi bacterium]|jgi:hypothetical protein|nr:hypothetical protein [Chloroflexota bacterium]